MVGGYVILTKKPLVLGDNDLGAMYGSIENAKNRIDTVAAIQKPVLVESSEPNGAHVDKFAEWFVVQSRSLATIVFSSIASTLTYTRSTGIATLALKD